MARHYGELTCDIPYLTAEKQLELLRDQFLERNEFAPFDIIYWTGDSIGHDLHNVSPEEVLETLQNLTDLVHQYFPKTPLINVLGNHDMYPPSI